VRGLGDEPQEADVDREPTRREERRREHEQTHP